MGVILTSFATLDPDSDVADPGPPVYGIWTPQPPGTLYTCIDDGVRRPNAPDVSDWIATSLGIRLSRIGFTNPGLPANPDRRYHAFDVWIYARSAVGASGVLMLECFSGTSPGRGVGMGAFVFDDGPGPGHLPHLGGTAAWHAASGSGFDVDESVINDFQVAFRSVSSTPNITIFAAYVEWTYDERSRSMVTNRGKRLVCDGYFRNYVASTQPTFFYLTLCRGAGFGGSDPTPDTKVFSELTEIPALNGYVAGGKQITRNSSGSTGFDVLNENDTDNRAELQLSDAVWTASGGSIPSSGSMRWAVLTDDNATPANRQVLAYWDLQAERVVSTGQTFTIQNAEIRLRDP